MTLDQMGNVGEVVAALATVATLIYLAGQLRQNTRALKATAFQAVVSEMGSNVQNLIDDNGLGIIFPIAIKIPSFSEINP